MKNNILIILTIILFHSTVIAENLKIEAKNITLDKNKEISIFENNVIIQTSEGNKIFSDYAEYNKKNQFVILKQNIFLEDMKGNRINTEYADYDDKSKIFKTLGKTEIITSDKYVVEGEDIIIDNLAQSIKSSKNTVITDKENNKIYLQNFEYITEENIFKSVGEISIKDKTNNTYEFSQIYIDTKKKEILGADIKAYLNDKDFKINTQNKPRIFANSMEMKKETKSFSKSIFTICNYRNNDKCPPWTIQSSKMLHDNKKKTIYYTNAVIKIYDIPIFYFPKLFHPDPTVERRTGFLLPTLTRSKNLGQGLVAPFFWDLNKDKNLTITNKLYVTENPLIMAEYHQVFKNSDFKLDVGFTDGYKKTNAKKRPGAKSHFFTKFEKFINSSQEKETKLTLKVENVSNDKYLKLYEIESDLVDYKKDTLENSIDFTHEDEDTFFGLNASMYETLKDDYNDKYEYLLPELTYDKNLISNNQLGILDYQANYKYHNFDTNKSKNFFVNDFNWNSKTINLVSGLKGKFLGNFRNINYEVKNVENFKNETSTELHAALGYLSEIDFIKKKDSSSHLLTPKMLLRLSPGNMRKEIDGSRLDPSNAFHFNRLNNTDAFETGISTTLGFDYKIKKSGENIFDFSVAQVINAKENKKMPSITGMDEKLSDFVGSTSFKMSDNFILKYDFALDQNYSDFNYNSIGGNFDFNPLKLDVNYLQEKKHIGDQDYLKSKLGYENNKTSIFLENKRNLITNSSEYYNLSYEYINDCLRAGLVYRREFYTDSELEPKNSLMFKVTLTPFGGIETPTFISQ